MTNPNDSCSKLISDHLEKEMKIPSSPYEKHPEILKDIKRQQELEKRGMKRKPGRVKPMVEIPMKQLLDDGDRAKDKYHREQTPTTGVNAYHGKWPGVETTEELLDAMNGSKPDNEIIQLRADKMKLVAAVGWCYLTIAVLGITCLFLTGLVLL